MFAAFAGFAYKYASVFVTKTQGEILICAVGIAFFSLLVQFAILAVNISNGCRWPHKSVLWYCILWRKYRISFKLKYQHQCLHYCQPDSSTRTCLSLLFFISFHFISFHFVSLVCKVMTTSVNDMFSFLFTSSPLSWLRIFQCALWVFGPFLLFAKLTVYKIWIHLRICITHQPKAIKPRPDSASALSQKKSKRKMHFSVLCILLARPLPFFSLLFMYHSSSLPEANQKSIWTNKKQKTTSTSHLRLLNAFCLCRSSAMPKSRNSGNNNTNSWALRD